MVFVLGLTGGIASGKTAATRYFSQLGVTIVDADIIAHDLVTKGSQALATICEHFGRDILQANGELDRARLRAIVFADIAEKQWLESYLHPSIRQEIQRQLAAADSVYVILSAPLLLETKLHTLSDRILIIDCDQEEQIKRACQRDNSDRARIETIIKQQINRDERLARTDDIITNNGSLGELQQAVEQYHHCLLTSISTNNCK